MTHVAGGAPAADVPVTAVLVSHDGARWLPQVLAALAALNRRPHTLVAVDTGSTDDSVRLLTAALGEQDVLAAPRDLPYAAAVARGLAHRPPADGGWIWLLHDDSAPAPDALAALLAEATAPGAEDVAVVGAKAREWPSLRRLLEVGVTIGGTGRRDTGLEPGEPDQGQRDVPRDVLAAGTAGLLVRADVWRDLGGLDPALGLADDLDLGWRVARAGHRVRVAPDAVVFHAEALNRGQRAPGSHPVRVRRERRRSALLVLLVSCRLAVLPVQWVRLLVGSALRALGLLLLKAPAEAWDEVRAVLSVHGRPFRLWRLRRARRRTARVPPSRVRHLLPSVWQPYRAGAATVLDVLASLAGAAGTAPRAYAEPGPVAEEAESLAPEPGLWQRVAARPWASVWLTLLVVALVASRDLVGGGTLQGGALLPAPDGASTWWAAHLASWHPVGVGSTEPAPPYLLVLAALALPVLGDAGLLVWLLLALSVPLAGLGAHRLLRRLPVRTGPRLWAAGAYAVLPLLTGALAQGRLGTVLGTVWLPVVAASVVGLVRAGPDRAAVRWAWRARAGLALAVLVALVPLAYPLALVVAAALLVAAVARSRAYPAGTAPLSVLVVLAAPWALAPWALLDRWRDPDAWWWEAGLADAGVGALDPGPAGLALAQPGGPGGAVLGGWLGAGVVVAAVLALLDRDTRAVVVPAWGVAALGLAAAGWGAGRLVDIGPAPVEAWTGFGLVVWWGGLLVAAAAAASDLRRYLADRSFGLLQPVAVAAVVAALAGPLLATGWAVVAGLDGPLRTGPAVEIPSYVAADARSGTRPAVVQLSGGPASGVDLTVVRDDGWRLGDEWAVDAVGSAAVSRAVSRAARDLLVAPEPADVDVLARAGVGYLYAPAPVDPDLAAALDTAPGLVRSGAPLGDRAWLLDLPAGQVRVSGAGTDAALALGVDRADGSPPWTATLPAGPAGRLTVAATPDQSWSVSVDGAEVTRRDGGSVQTFELGERTADTDLVVEHDTDRGWWVAGQLAALALLVLVALPTRRRRP